MILYFFQIIWSIIRYTIWFFWSILPSITMITMPVMVYLANVPLIIDWTTYTNRHLSSLEALQRKLDEDPEWPSRDLSIFHDYYPLTVAIARSYPIEIIQRLLECAPDVAFVKGLNPAAFRFWEEKSTASSPLSAWEFFQQKYFRTEHQALFLRAQHRLSFGDKAAEFRPLHAAAVCESRFKEVLHRFFRTFAPTTEGFLQADENGNLPLHIACLHHRFAGKDYITRFLNACPEAAMVANHDGKFPLDIVLENPAYSREPKFLRLLFDHSGGKYHFKQFALFKHCNIMEMPFTPSSRREDQCLEQTDLHFQMLRQNPLQLEWGKHMTISKKYYWDETWRSLDWIWNFSRWDGVSSSLDMNDDEAEEAQNDEDNNNQNSERRGDNKKDD